MPVPKLEPSGTFFSIAPHGAGSGLVEKRTPGGPAERRTGEAELVGPGQLKVAFASVPFVRGDYWVLWVDDAYTTAVVGTPAGSAGWILARSPTISAAKRAEAEAVLQANGYDISALIEVPQPPQ